VLSENSEKQQRGGYKNIKHLYKNTEEADFASDLFFRYLENVSSKPTDPWVLFTSKMDNFHQLTKLIPGSFGNMNIITLLICIFGFIIHARLSANFIESLLLLIAGTLPSLVVNYFPTTLYQFNKFFNELEQPTYSVIRYCTCCSKEYDEKHVPSTSHKVNKGLMILYDINSILRLKLKSKQFCSELLLGLKAKELQQQSDNSDELCNICDGRIIRELRQVLNALYPHTNLSFSLFLDGVKAFKSSNLHLYPCK
jgi:hypothetical protein